MEEEKYIIWASHVLAPFSISGNSHAFLVQIHSAFEKPECLDKFFTCLRRCEHKIFKDRAYELGFMSAPICVFHYFPSPKTEAYIDGLNKVEKKKIWFQRDQEIYDFIQLYITVLMFNPNMLIKTLLFQEGSANNFHLRCRMVTPTLFDTAAIVGHQPIGETFDPTFLTSTKPNSDFDHVVYKNFIKDVHGTGG